MDDYQEQGLLNEVQDARLRAEMERTRNIQQEVMLSQQEGNMIQEQLDLEEELDRIDYLLRGYSMEIDPETKEKRWLKPENTDMIILSNYGVHLIRNTIAWYLNKNTLLSNYGDDVILNKMEDFADALNDTIFMEYDKVFQYPTFEDCKDILKDRLKNKINIRVFAKEILGQVVSEEEKKQIEDQVIREIELIIEKELDKIRQQLIKNKLKRFLILIREIQDAVHSAYNRAYQGQERKTLREHIHITETKGTPMPQQQKGGWFGFMRRK
jgi:hypothetical protein